MQKTFFGIAFSLLTALTVSGQDQAALRNDPTYSTHNYKHPNKAAAAATWANKKGVRVAAPGYDPQRVVNYKQPKSGASPTVGIALPHTPSASLADRNYKIQGVNSSRPASQPDTQLVSKPRRQLVPEGE
jgi:hypothetical protein